MVKEISDVFWLGICDKSRFGMVTSNRSVSDMNIGLIATGKSNLDGVTHMELWRMRDYTYEITASSYVGYPKGFNKVTELLEETPYEVAVKKFENMVDNIKLM